MSKTIKMFVTLIVRRISITFKCVISLKTAIIGKQVITHILLISILSILAFTKYVHITIQIKN